MSRTIRGFVPIINPGKCGSSWLAHALTIRPYMSFPREFDFIFFLIFPLSKQWNKETAENPDYLRIRKDTEKSNDEKLLCLYNLERKKYPRYTKIIDKAPSNVYSGFEQFHHLYSDLKLIFLYRDPRDVYISNEFFHQRQLGRKEIHEDIGNPDYMLKKSVFRNTFENCQKVLQIEKLLSNEGYQLHKLTYEGLKIDFQNQIWKILEFLDLRVKPSSLVQSNYIHEPIPLDDHIERAKNFRPLYRKGIIGDWRNYLYLDSSKQLVKEAYGSLLIELGYETDFDW